MAGRCREIRAARWLIDRIIPAAPAAEQPPVTASDPILRPPAITAPAAEPDPTTSLSLTATTVNLMAPEANFRVIKSVLLDAILAKLPTSLQNQTNQPLEIDILKPQKKQDLFLMVLKRFEETLDDLRLAQIPRSQLPLKRSRILTDLWEATTADFFGKYLTLPFGAGATEPEVEAIEIVQVLQQDQAIVQTEILDKIPLVAELLDHLLFQTPLVVENAVYAVGSPASGAPSRSSAGKFSGSSGQWRDATRPQSVRHQRCD